jgi:hypothetical protein
MPYFVYRVFPFARLEKVAEHAAFSAASTQAKQQRISPDLPQGCKVKVIFADNELHAEDLLSQVRQGEGGAIGDE